MPCLTNITSHIIDTGDNPPVKQKCYRYDKQKTDIIEWHEKKMLNECIIQRTSSPYCSPSVLCHKQNGKPAESPEAWRVAIDYRKLNNKTVSHNYPMPRMENLRHKVMSPLDLIPSYYKIPIREQNISKTAFIVPSESYVFHRMSFGFGLQ